MTAASGFPMPQAIKMEEETANERYAKFVAAPLKSGYGHTLGNSLRRVLLSSLEGAAICAVRIEGVSHEFASLPNVVEDVTEIVLNLKRVKLNLHGEINKTLEIKSDKAGAVTAANINADGTVEVLNPEQVICTLDKDMPFRAEIDVIKGTGYIPAEKQNAPKPENTIPIDCLFSPVTRVNYHVGAARVGEETEMDSLQIEIWTDGRVMPADALENAAKILKDHLMPFLGGQPDEKDVIAVMSDEELKQYKQLSQDVEVLDLSVRAMNCLNNANIKIIGELCTKTEHRMLKYRNFGKKSLDEIKEKIESLGLSLGMTFSENLLNALDAEAERIKALVVEEK
jgi:DNA-directed RNA polymerase subunit alpha